MPGPPPMVTIAVVASAPSPTVINVVGRASRITRTLPPASRNPPNNITIAPIMPAKGCNDVVFMP